MVAIVGRPNVGKSTLLNEILGQKLSITSRRPQTTRHRLLGVKTRGTAQAVYIDTPGLQTRPRRGLNRSMNREVARALADVDVALFVIEAPSWTPADTFVARQLAGMRAPVVLVANKIDRVADKRRLLPFLKDVSEHGDFAEIFPVSALRAVNVEELERTIERFLPAGPWLFADDVLTDRSERFLVAELVREKLIRLLGEELPYSVSVITDEFAEHDDGVRIAVTIWVEKRSQRGIVVGGGGAMLKRVGTEARRDIEALLGHHVYLATWVKVKENWADDATALARLGYDL
ncbi:MAG: GTPase Era [Gammaproteobacteria bacterium]|nr:GTPase Era [Gammaproteobacteria bacterium]